MAEIIFEMIAYVFVEIIFEGIILRIFRGIKLAGLLLLKLLTMSDKSINELKEKYKDSSKPYFLGFGITIGLTYLIIRIAN